MWENLGQRGRSNIKRADLSFRAFVRHLLTHTEITKSHRYLGLGLGGKVREQTVNCDGGVGKAPEEAM